MLELLLKSSFAIGIAFLFYKLLLQQESFFSTNRLYLLGCLALAFVLPFVTLPKLISHQGYLSVVLQQEQATEAGATQESETAGVSAQNYNIPVPETPVQPDRDQEIKTTADETATNSAIAEKTTAANEISWGFWLLMLYLFGVAVFTLSLLFQVGTIFYKIATATDKIEDGDCVIVNTAGRQAPCSFFKYIFIYPDDYDYETYEQIIAHEKIHARLGHSFDLVLAEIAVIILWFNPLVWLFKREIEKNNEYQTDAILIEKEKVRREQYQFNLLQIAVPNKPLSITTNYNQSLLKQRIMMMNAKKSTVHAYWKYAFLVPLYFGTLLFMNKPAQSSVLPASIASEEAGSQPVEAQKAVEVPFAQEVPGPAMIGMPVEVTQEDAVEKKGLKETIKEKVNENVKEGIKESVKASVKSSVKQGYSINTTSSRVDMTEGYWYSNKEGNKYCINFKGSQNASSWNMSDCFESSLFKKQGNDVFAATKGAGKLQLTGNLDAEVGQGKFKFTEDASFKKFLAENNLSGTDKNLMFHLFFGDINRKYVDYLKKNYSDLSAERLQELAVHGISQQESQNYLALFQKYSNTKPGINDIIAARIHGIDAEYIKEIQAMGYKDLSMKKMMEAKIHGIDAAYVESLRKLGFKDLPINKVIAAKIHGVTAASVKEAQALGFGDLTLDQIMQANIHNLDAAYMKELQSVGIKGLNMSQYIEAKIHGLDSDVVKELRGLGYEDASYRELLSAQIHKVDAAYLNDLKKAGFENISLSKAAEAKIHGVDGDFIKKARKDGYNLSTIDKYISLKIHGSAMESLKERD